jgi:HSP20 family molecular chaperone IbpA
LPQARQGTTFDDMEAQCAFRVAGVGVGWDPFADVFRIAERFGGRFRGGLLGADDDGDAAASLPRADVYEDTDGLTIDVELSGIAAADVSVHLSGESIVVEAERRFARNGRQVRQIETPFGRLRREFVLPVRALPERVSAEMRSGLLRIVIPRAPSRMTATFAVHPSEQNDVINIPVQRADPDPSLQTAEPGNV